MPPEYQERRVLKLLIKKGEGEIHGRLFGFKQEMETITCTPPVKRKVLGDIKNKTTSPISPTANLKLLTTVAAARCDLIENEEIIKIFATPPKCQNVTKGHKISKPAQSRKGERKYKSLGFLCDKFLKLYPLDVPKNGNNQRILLTSLSQHLGVEKRRVYDIINVVESLQMATKVGKNMYSWEGRLTLADTLSHLKVYAEQTGLSEYVRMQQLNRKLFIHLHPGEVDTTDAHIFSENSSVANMFRNERRIGILCQKFIMIFLVSLKEGVVNLELATDVLMGEKCKMRLRRLYDIANILVALGIIEKLDDCRGWKKPAFRYIGPLILMHQQEINVDCPLLQRLVEEGTDCSNDTTSIGNVSEDSCEVQDEPVPSVTDMDHSYSLFPITAEKPVAVVPPAAKKKLIFPSISRKMAVQKSPQASLSEGKVKKEEPLVEHIGHAQTSSSFLQIVSHSSQPQPIQHGAIYKALKIGNDIQLIRLDES